MNKKEQDAFNILNSISGMVCRSILLEKGICTEAEFDEQLMKIAKDIDTNKMKKGRR